MIKKFLNVFKVDKSKLTMEELKICEKALNISMIVFVILMVIIGTFIVLASKGITFGYVGVVIVALLCICLVVIAFNAGINNDIQKLENAKNNDLKAKSIITLIKEGKFDEIYCKDKELNKLLFDICLEKRNIEISIKEDNILIKTAEGIEILFKVENVNKFFGKI